jgi:Zn-dependent peptidase ImmA (M78 family)
MPKTKSPINIEAILDFDLGIRIHEKKNLYRELDINAFLSNDAKEIFVDEDGFFNDRKEHIMRYALAHEIGHLQLHKDYLPTLRAKTIEEWKEIKTTLPNEQYNTFEFQAYEFAGRLLISPDLLRNKIKEQSENIQHVLSEAPDLPVSYIAERLSSRICKFFGVSDKVVLKRIQIEGIDITKL